MNKAAVETTVSIGKRVYVDKPKRNARCLQDRINLFDIGDPQPIVALVEPRHKYGNIIMARADKLRQWSMIAASFAEEDALIPIASFGKTIIADQNSMQAVNLCLVQWAFACFQNGASPSFQTIYRRAFSLDFKACFAIGKQQKTGSAGNHMCTGLANGFAGFGGQIKRDHAFQIWCPANNRTKCAGAKQVVSNTVARRHAHFTSVIGGGVERIDGCHGWCIINIKNSSGQDFKEKPNSPRYSTCGRPLDKCDQIIFRDNVQNPFQDQQVHRLVAQGKCQMTFQCRVWPIALVVDFPATFDTAVSPNVFFRDT